MAGRIVDFFRRINQLKELITDETYVQLDQAAVLLEQEQFDAALKKLSVVLEQHPDHAKALYLSGLCHLRRWSDVQDQNQAIDFFQHALQSNPALIEAMVSLAQCHEKTGNLFESSRLYRSLLQKTENPDWAHAALLGLGKAQGAHPTRALRFLRKALQIKPEDPATQGYLAMAYCEKYWRTRKLRGHGKNRFAVPVKDFLSRAIANNILPIEGYAAFDRLLAQEKDHSSREPLLRKMEQRFPREPLFFLRKALFEKSCGALDRAEQAAIACIQHTINHKEWAFSTPLWKILYQSHCLLANIQIKRRQPRMAIETFGQLWQWLQTGRYSKWLSPLFRRVFPLVFREQAFDANSFFLQPVIDPLLGPKYARRDALFKGHEQALLSLLCLGQEENAPEWFIQEEEKNALFTGLARAFWAYKKGRLFDAISILRNVQELHPSNSTPKRWIRKWSSEYGFFTATSFQAFVSAFHDFLLQEPRLADLQTYTHAALSALKRPLQVAVMGEFNTGKSTFINALLGENIVPSGITPTTAVATFLSYATAPCASLCFANGSRQETTWERGLAALVEPVDESLSSVELAWPHPLLQRMTLMDTPGFNALNPDHEARTLALFDQADAFLWIFSADQAGKATEREVLQTLLKQGSVPILGIINKMDRLDLFHPLEQGAPDQDALAKVLAHLRLSLPDQIALPLLPVSAEQASKAQPNATFATAWKNCLAHIENNLLNRSDEIKEQRAAHRLCRALQQKHGAIRAGLSDAPEQSWPRFYRSQREQALLQTEDRLAVEKRLLFAQLEQMYLSVAEWMLEILPQRGTFLRNPTIHPADMDAITDGLVKRMSFVMRNAFQRTNIPAAEPLFQCFAAQAKGHFQSGWLEVFLTGHWNSVDRDAVILGRILEKTSPTTLEKIERDLFDPLLRLLQENSLHALRVSMIPLQKKRNQRFETEQCLLRPLSFCLARLKQQWRVQKPPLSQDK